MTKPAPGYGGDQAGYTLVGLLVAVAVVNVALAVAVTSWRSIDTRAREAELIWRGEKIARAIACHGATEGAEPLEKLEQLIESNCLRRLYRDPMSPDGQWRILRQADVADGTIAALQGQPAPGVDGIGGEEGLVGGGESAGASTAPGITGPRLQIAPALERPSLSGGVGGLSTGGVGSADTIIGVMSKKTGATKRLYRTHDRYERWLFLSGQDVPQ